MIDRDHELSVTRQAEVVGVARSTVYYLPRPVSAADLDLIVGSTASYGVPLRRGAGCCAVYWLPMAARSAGVT